MGDQKAREAQRLAQRHAARKDPGGLTMDLVD